jgi:hypothetical protein
MRYSQSLQDRREKREEKNNSPLSLKQIKPAMTLAYQEEEEQVIQALTLPMYMDVSTV